MLDFGDVTEEWKRLFDTGELDGRFKGTLARGSCAFPDEDVAAPLFQRITGFYALRLSAQPESCSRAAKHDSLRALM